MKRIFKYGGLASIGLMGLFLIGSIFYFQYWRAPSDLNGAYDYVGHSRNEISLNVKRLKQNDPTLVAVYVDVVDQEGIKAIAEALKHNTICKNFELNLTSGVIYPHIEDATWQALGEGLKVNKSIQNISLYQSKLGDEGMKALAEALKVNNVQHIDLSDNQIGDEGAKALAEVLKVNTSIRSIEISVNKIGDEGIKALSQALKVNTTLQYLGLAANKIGRAGGEALADALKTNKALQLCLASNEYSLLKNHTDFKNT
jgi:Ran GTPase-activating protein (RanGAP) involved in mRNA processing and transport